MLDMNLAAAPALDVEHVQSIAFEDQDFINLIGEQEIEFVNSVLLSQGEARYWQDDDCAHNNCAHATFYNYTAGGTLEAVINLDAETVVGSWQNSYARPGGSTHIVKKAVEIAAQDAQVIATLGDIGAADPAMVPMSGWLADDACRDEWCVDLTFVDPEGSGRIYHIFVNMEQEIVARTFYTRGRPDRAAAKPVSQRNAYTDDCHKQYGWEICWEMTANDGVNFRDATYKGDLIFSSAKIAQVEAWYPSWPGGYRDEIGFAASVPPFDDTVVTDLGDGFEIRQMFTEFTRWPNCVCCYRYEEVVQLFEDGRFNFRFISHGPGCDDLSIYRPFWRIDIDLDGPDNDSVWLWTSPRWTESTTEFETYPFVDDVSPDGFKLSTSDGDLSYRWQMDKTDPLGLDEAYLFGLQFKEGEGDGPILTGPGDTFIPPRQWVDGDPLSGENVVLWYVPLLNTKIGGPWWCQPDPEPDFSPCEAVLHAIPAGELTQPDPEDIATLEPTPDALFTPTPVPTPAPTATPRPLEGETAEEILRNAGCTSCHKIGELGESHKVGPDLSGIGLIAQQRVSGLSAAEYLRQSIVDPNAFVPTECPNGACMPNIMPRDYEIRLSTEQIGTVVAHLLTMKTIAEPEIIGASTLENGQDSSKNVVPAAKTAVPQQAGPITPLLAVQLLFLTLVFFVSLFIFIRSGKEKV